jgi:hypothetical protein
MVRVVTLAKGHRRNLWNSWRRMSISSTVFAMIVLLTGSVNLHSQLAAPPAPEAPATEGTVAQPPAAANRFIVFLFDDRHLGPANLEPVKKAAVRMLDLPGFQLRDCCLQWDAIVGHSRVDAQKRQHDRPVAVRERLFKVRDPQKRAIATRTTTYFTQPPALCHDLPSFVPAVNRTSFA